ncbi:diguanylate cyclase [Candidatus Sumerlaeota bacterium]|nr:diguanylate cyclase [Candidatus Sumerlaeota bacterium]
MSEDNSIKIGQIKAARSAPADKMLTNSKCRNSGEALRRSQEKIKKLKKRYQAVLRSTPHGLCMLSPDWQIIWTNFSMSKLLYPDTTTTQDISGMPFRALFANEKEFEQYKESVENSIQKFGLHLSEQVMKRVDGTRLWCEISIVPLDPLAKESGYVATVTDVTERRRAEEALRTRIRFENLVMAISTNFINLTANQIDRGINKALESIGKFAGVDSSYVFLFSRDGKEMNNTHGWCARGIDSHWRKLQGIPADAFPWFISRLKRFETIHIQSENDLPSEATNERKHYISAGVKSLIAVPMVYAGKLMGFLGFVSMYKEKKWSDDIIRLLRIVGEIVISALERKRAEETIRRLAYYDSLTGLPNRVLFKERLRLELAHARRNREKLAVMLLDLDRFKNINDTLGHDMGDKLLKSVGNRLKRTLRRSDTVSRMGGDEFLLLLPELERIENVRTIADKIMGAFQKPFRINGHVLQVTTSLGIAIYPQDGEVGDTLIKHADIAMYRAKELGRNTYQFYHS